MQLGSMSTMVSFEYDDDDDDDDPADFLSFPIMTASFCDQLLYSILPTVCGQWPVIYLRYDRDNTYDNEMYSSRQAIRYCTM